MHIKHLTQWSVVAFFASSSMVATQEPPSLQKLFESGQYAAVVERAGDGRAAAPEDGYVAALAQLKSENTEGAIAEMNRLRDRDDEVWKHLGTSGVAMLQHKDGESVEAARRATDLAPDNPYAQFQLGLAAAGANDFGTAVEAFTRATELKPDFAYAHYYAGQAQQRQKNLGRAADHYAYFLKLAPESPDRNAVQAIMRALRR